MPTPFRASSCCTRSSPVTDGRNDLKGKPSCQLSPVSSARNTANELMEAESGRISKGVAIADAQMCLLDVLLTGPEPYALPNFGPKKSCAPIGPLDDVDCSRRSSTAAPRGRCAKTNVVEAELTMAALLVRPQMPSSSERDVVVVLRMAVVTTIDYCQSKNQYYISLALFLVVELEQAYDGPLHVPCHACGKVSTSRKKWIGKSPANDHTELFRYSLGGILSGDVEQERRPDADIEACLFVMCLYIVVKELYLL